ncbi:pyridoxal phosphate-dependent transferase [Scheffersomyces coipomensis]|uniref:pyridoxal phosphate-dependent transferase n=1 Tax=Scheffersomyces coipomensis TaxID=1788519 RepID=UPI00315CF084
MTVSNQPVIPFGKKFRETYFKQFDSKITPVNHGSYGASPTIVLEKYYEQLKRNYNYPDYFFRVEILEGYEKSLKAVSEILKCDYRNLAIVDNATSGVNTILRSYPFAKGDKIVIPSTVYGACHNTVKFLQNRYGIVPVIITLDYPIEDDEIISKFENVFKKESPKLCLFDTVISMPGVRFPFEKLTESCRKYDVLSLIDGAHSIGLVTSLNLGTLKPDFYTSNLHKWLFVPAGCAVLYVDSKHHHQVHTMPISHSYLDDKVNLDEEGEKTRFVDTFAFFGTKNYSSTLVIPEAIKFRNEICGGEETINKYCYGLAQELGDLLENSKGTLSNALITIEVPTEKYGINIKLIEEKFEAFVNIIFSKMFTDYNTYIPLSVHNHKLYARFSAQIYNEISDYEYSSSVMLEILEGLKNDKAYVKLAKPYSKL